MKYRLDVVKCGQVVEEINLTVNTHESLKRRATEALKAEFVHQVRVYQKGKFVRSFIKACGQILEYLPKEKRRAKA